jgi:hypothetical protein
VGGVIVTHWACERNDTLSEFYEDLVKSADSFYPDSRRRVPLSNEAIRGARQARRMPMSDEVSWYL